MHIIIIALVLCGAYANDDTQYIKSVKGGHRGGYNYNPANYPSFGGYNLHQNATQQGYGSYNASQHGYGTQNTSRRIDFEVGVCYIEVPTASLVQNPAHIPAGNGSRPDLSRIRTCCKGYIRNMHNFKICDPVCSQECVNGLCTAPETCTCFPDHVRNLAGFCVPTCPIGCQNGHCSGGECLCKEGYKLDSESKYCIPNCKENCGGLGNCTDSNICQCKNGYQSTPNGNCKPVCDRCYNGDCVAPNDCRCKVGYNKNSQGQCEPQCPQGCGPSGRCIAPNVCDNPIPTRPHTYPVSPPNPIYQTRPMYPGNDLHNGKPVNPGDKIYPGNQYPGQNMYTQDIPTNPMYPGNQVYPGNQGYPGNQVYPGQQSYPGNQNYPSNQVNPANPVNPGNQVYPGSQVYPGNQMYPGNQVHPGNQVNPGNQVYPGNQFYPSSQVTSQNQSSYGSQVNTTGYQTQYGSHDQSGYNRFQGQTVNQLYPDIQQAELLQCPQPCINGVCEDGIRCRCNSGYTLDVNDPTQSRCLPYCPGGCPNGICSAPHFCICNAGYIKDTSVKGRPSCVKRIRRSIDTPTNLADILIFDIPDDY